MLSLAAKLVNSHTKEDAYLNVTKVVHSVKRKCNVISSYKPDAPLKMICPLLQ